MTNHLVRVTPAAVLLLCLASFGQVFSGSLTGVVKDPSGAAVPNASAVLTDTDKGFTYASVSDTDGRYVLRNLPPGHYSLKVTAAGMRPYTQPALTLTVGQNAEVNVDFEIQGTAEKVDVEATATLLETQDASTGQLVNLAHSVFRQPVECRDSGSLYGGQCAARSRHRARAGNVHFGSVDFQAVCRARA